VLTFIPYWDRQCVFPDNPDFTHICALDQYGKDKVITDKWNRYTKDQRNAFRDYFMYLQNENLVKLKTSSLYAWVNNIHAKTKTYPLVINTRQQTVVTPTGYYKEALGALFDVSVNEWLSYDTWQELIKHGLYDDPRISHLTPKNHSVLADKLIKYFETGETVDLTKDFHQHFLDKDYVDISVNK
jgi:hypothetical protein